MAIPRGLLNRTVVGSASTVPQNCADTMHSKTEKKSGQDTVPFRVLVRRGAKSQARELAVPKQSSLAMAAEESGENERAVQLEMKRLVLTSKTLNNSEDDRGYDSIGIPMAVALSDNSANSEPTTHMERQNKKREQEAILLSALFKPKSGASK